MATFPSAGSRPAPDSGLGAAGRTELQPRWLPVARGVAFWLIAYLFAATMLGTTIPTSLYGDYESQWHFSSGIVTVIYASYAVGVLAALLLLGRSSDAVGRRPVLGAALALSTLSTVVFILAPGLGWLFVGRVVSGLSAGLVTGTATATLTDLATAGSSGRASMVATAANMGGLGLGPAVAGLFAQYLPRPTVLVFEVYLAVLALAALALLASPETVSPRRRLNVRFEGLGIPTEGRGAFIGAGVAAFVAFSLLGMFSALAPTFLGESLHQRNRAVDGAIVLLIFAAATIAQLLLAHRSATASMRAGLWLFFPALALIVAALSASSLALFIIGTAAVGVAVGAAFIGSLSTANHLSPPHLRGQVISTYFTFAYVGLTIPVIGVGFGSQAFGIFRSVLVCSVVLAALSGAVALGMYRLESQKT